MEKDVTKKQELVLDNREKFTCDMVDNVVSFTDEQILLKTGLGGLEIKGSQLRLEDFSVENGKIVAEGKIDSVIFVTMKEKTSFLKGLFR